jgi:hypothetical protein
VRAANQDYPPPNFLIMIGNRYGSVPLPYAISQDEFEVILDWLESHGRQAAANALRYVYQRDDNHLVPHGLSQGRPGDGMVIGAYTLRSRIDELPELESVSAWAEREAELRAILQDAVDGLLALSRIDHAVHEKYFLSLTDQEIICGLPGYRAVPAGAAPLPSAGADSPSAIAFIREIVIDPGPAPEPVRRYFDQQPRLDALKEGIKRSIPENHIVMARTAVDERGRFSETYLADFAAQIHSKLKAAIDHHITRVEAIERSPDHALESERDAHRTFAQRKLEIFVGRLDALAAITHYLATSAIAPLVVHGHSGFGKSALMARAIAAAETAGGAPVVGRLIGASAASSNLRSLLISVVDDLAAHGCLTKPSEFEQDAIKFNTQIERCSRP